MAYISIPPYTISSDIDIITLNVSEEGVGDYDNRTPALSSPNGVNIDLQIWTMLTLAIGINTHLPDVSVSVPNNFVALLASLQYAGIFNALGLGVNNINAINTTTYYMRGWDTNGNFVYWHSTGAIETNPTTTVPALVGTLQAVTVIGSI